MYLFCRGFYTRTSVNLLLSVSGWWESWSWLLMMVSHRGSLSDECLKNCRETVNTHILSQCTPSVYHVQTSSSLRHTHSVRRLTHSTCIHLLVLMHFASSKSRNKTQKQQTSHSLGQMNQTWFVRNICFEQDLTDMPFSRASGDECIVIME